METKRQNLSFSKAEKLCSKKIIDAIYTEGKKIKQFPFILNFMEVPDDVHMAHPVQIVISVPKRNIKRAVDRNRLKRQIREAYRLNKEELITTTMGAQKKLALFLIYLGKANAPYSAIEQKLKLVLTQLQDDQTTI